MVAENLALQATALGLAATPVGTFTVGMVKVRSRWMPAQRAYFYFAMTSYTHHTIKNPE